MSTLRAAVRHPVNAFLTHFSTVLVLFGAGLFLVGGAIQASRSLELSRAERSQAAPLLPNGSSWRAHDSAASPAGAPVPDMPPPDLRAILHRTDALVLTPRPTPRPTALPTAAPPPDTIVIPSIGLNSRVEPVGWEARIVNGKHAANEWLTADYAAGWHGDSARPGELGNMVISGHNNIFGKVFANLHKLVPGDVILVYSGEAAHTYRVEQNFVVREAGATRAQREANARWIDATDDERLTLVTCYPPWSNTHRTIIVARPDAGAMPTANHRRDGAPLPR